MRSPLRKGDVCVESSVLPTQKFEELAGDYVQDSAGAADQSLLRQRISAALGQLRDPRCRDVLFLYYGLEGSYVHTYEHIARILKTSRERVRAMHCCTLRWLGLPKYQLRSLWEVDGD